MAIIRITLALSNPPLSFLLEHLTDFVFVTMANTTLLRRDSYLAYLKAGIKADTMAALRTAPLHPISG